MVKASNEEAEALICSRADFNSSLASITWANSHLALFAFSNGSAAVVPNAGLTPHGWTTFDTATGAGITGDEVTAHRHFLSIEAATSPLHAYYILSAEGASKEVFLIANARQLGVVRSNWLGPARLFDWAFEHDSKGKNNGLTDSNFTIVHDQSGQTVYGWFIELNDKEQGNRAVLSIYSLWLGGEERKYAVDFDAKREHGYYALLSEGSLKLADERSLLAKFENEKTTVKWAANATHGRAPRGFVDYRTGTLYLVDDRKGCVYSVLNWGRPTLVRTHDHLKVMQYAAFGTAFERFFSCQHVKSVKSAGEEDADRCSLGGDSELYRDKGFGSFRGTPFHESSEDDAQKNGGIRGGAGGGGGGHLLMIFLSVGGALLLLLLLVIGLYRKGNCCSKKGKSKTVSGKSSKTAKSGNFKSSASASSKMMVASKGGAGGGKAMPKSSIGGTTSSAAGKSSVSSAATPSDYFPSSSAVSSTTSSSSKTGK